jgi:hypothetical protein
MSSSGMLRRVALVRTDVSEGTYLFHHQGKKNQRTRNVSGNLKHNDDSCRPDDWGDTFL